MTEQERREHFAFLNGVAADMKESRKEIIDLLEGIKAEIGSEINVTLDQYSIRQNDYCDGLVFAMKQVLEIIDHHINEYTE